MKKLNTLFILLLCFTSLIAQERGLVITYNQQTQIDINPKKNKEYIQAMEDAVKRIDQSELTTTTKKAIFKPIEKINNEQEEEENTRSYFVVLNDMQPFFIDLEKQKVYEIIENFTQKYEVTDSLKKYDWQLIRESKKVLNFDCKKAVAKDGKKEITAWYAPKLPYRVGPNTYTGLPGTILELEIKIDDKENTKSHYWATDVQVKDDIILDFPEFKNLMTKEEYDIESKKFWKKFKSMQSQGVDKD